MNPGQLPPSLTPEALHRPHASLPRNPLLAEPLFLARYIEKAGTGTLDMIELAGKRGLPTPEFGQTDGQVLVTLRRLAGSTTPEVTPEVARLLAMLGDKALSRRELQQTIGLKDDEHFRIAYLRAALDARMPEMTCPTNRTARGRNTASLREVADGSWRGARDNPRPRRSRQVLRGDAPVEYREARADLCQDLPTQGAAQSAQDRHGARTMSRTAMSARRRRKAPIKLLPFDGARYLTDDEAVAEYMNAVLQTDDPHLLLLALADVARARGMAQVAKDAGLGPSP